MAAPRKKTPARAARSSAAAVVVGEIEETGPPPPVVVEADPETIPDALTFTTPEDPGAQARREDPGTPFALDGETFLAFEPKKAVRAMLFAAAAQSASDADRINAILTWCDAALSPLSNMRIKQRLLDRTDDLGVEDLSDLMTRLTEYWDARDGSRATRRALGKQRAPAAAARRRR